MRYSIIHHDIREHFGLSLHEYIVCDSIHQLSHGIPTHKTDAEIAIFLGLDRSTVSKTKIKLLEKGLIFESNGFTTTEKWDAEVLGKKSHRGDRIPKSGISSPRSIYKEYKEPSASAENEEIPNIVEVPIDNHGDEREGRQRPPKADVSYRAVFKLFKTPYPKNWDLNKTQIQAAKNLLEERGLREITKALEFHRESIDHKFCPGITSPYDLDSKWSKLFAFKQKYG